MKATQVLVAMLVLGSLEACAPTLAGQLKDPGGEAVTNAEARVNIISLSADPETAKVITVEVDGQGVFSTRETLAPGNYLIEALVPGYTLASKTVKLSEAEHVELTLAPVGAAKPATTRANTELDATRGGGDAMLMPPSL